MTNVSLRVKKIANAKESLYLDFYPPITNPSTGKPTRREFLGLYLNSDTITDEKGKVKKIKLNPIDKLHNKETKELAENIKAPPVVCVLTNHLCKLILGRYNMIFKYACFVETQTMEASMYSYFRAIQCLKFKSPR